MDAQNFDEFINEAKPGDSFVYYTGDTPRARLLPGDKEYDDCAFRIAARMAEGGFFTLFQKQIGKRIQSGLNKHGRSQNVQINTYEYLLVRISIVTQRKLDRLSQECTLKALEDSALRPDLGR